MKLGSYILCFLFYKSVNYLNMIIMMIEMGMRMRMKYIYFVKVDKV